MERRKILFSANGKNVKVTIKGKTEDIDHVVEALQIRQQLEKMSDERSGENLELANSFRNQFQKGDEESQKYGAE